MPTIFTQLFDIFVLLLALAFVIFLAYFSIRFMGRARSAKSGGNIKVIEAIGVGFQSTLQLVRAGDKIFLIGVSRSGITVIGEVNPDTISAESKVASGAPFEKYLSKFFNKDKGENDQ